MIKKFVITSKSKIVMIVKQPKFFSVATLGVILETEGSVWKIQKKALFLYKKVKKGTPNLASPYAYKFLEKKKKKVIKSRVWKLDSVLA